MTWNYRVMRKVDEATGRVSYGIHAFHYDIQDQPYNNDWSEMPEPVIAESLEDVRWTLERMIEALGKPVLDHETGQPTNDSVIE